MFSVKRRPIHAMGLVLISVMSLVVVPYRALAVTPPPTYTSLTVNNQGMLNGVTVTIGNVAQQATSCAGGICRYQISYGQEAAITYNQDNDSLYSTDQNNYLPAQTVVATYKCSGHPYDTYFECVQKRNLCITQPGVDLSTCPNWVVKAAAYTIPSQTEYGVALGGCISHPFWQGKILVGGNAQPGCTWYVTGPKYVPPSLP